MRCQIGPNELFETLRKGQYYTIQAKTTPFRTSGGVQNRSIYTIGSLNGPKRGPKWSILGSSKGQNPYYTG